MSHAPCQICGSNAEPLINQDSFQWVRCVDCAFVYLDPMPSVHESHNGAPSIDSAALGADYVSVYEKKFDSKLRRSRKRARYLNRYLKGDHFLDIGCNIGAFTDCMRRAGRIAYGIEINDTVLAFARKKFPDNKFLGGKFEDFDFGDLKFDGFYCSEVIEHVVDINRFLEKIARVSRPGAVLYLTTPHVREFVKRTPKESWPSFKAPDHKLYFNDDNLERSLGRHGFHVVKNRYTFNRGAKLIAARV